MSVINYIIGGYCEYFESAEGSPLTQEDVGLLVGMDSRGVLVPAGDCRPFIGVYGGSRPNVERGRTHAVHVGAYRWLTPFYEEGLVLGQRVYVREGRLVSTGIDSVGILAGYRNINALIVR